MANKRQYITELGEKTLIDITSAPEKWRSFLDTAAWHHKYPFYEQTLIYAQRPNAKACATFETWNNTLNRRIKRGSTGIGIVNPNNTKEHIRYLFDIADTYSRENKDFKLWELPADSEERIIDELEDNFGDALYPDSSFEEKLSSIIQNTVEDNITNYYEEYGKFVYEVTGDMPQTENAFKSLVEESVKYMAAVRMRLDVDEFLLESPFEDIIAFNDEHSAMAVGAAVSEISEMLLRQVAKTIFAIRAEERKKFAEQNKQAQNIVRNDERSAENGNHIPGSGRPSVPRTGNAGTAGRHNRQVRDDEGGISQEPQENPVQQTVPERSVEETPAGNRPSGDGAGREDSQRASQSQQRQRRPETARPNALGGNDEQSQAGGRGDSDRRTDNQITEQSKPKPRYPYEEPEAPADGSFVYQGIPQEYVEDLLRFGSNRQDSLYRIVNWYSRQHSEEENIQFLKEEYGKGGLGFFEDDKAISTLFVPDGINFAFGESVAATKHKTTVPWSMCSWTIEKLLSDGKYVSQETLDKASDYEKHTLAYGIYFLMRDTLRGFEHNLWPERTLADEAIKNIEEMLGSYAGLESITNIMNGAQRYIQTDTDTNKTLNQYNKVNKLLNEFKKPSAPYPVTLYQSKEFKRFITKDEIFLFLTAQEHISNAKLSTYDFFKKETDSQKRADFLKNLHGTGGAYGSTPLGDGFVDYSAKGIILGKGNSQNPNAFVQLSWQTVAKNIGAMIDADVYLTVGEKDRYPRYIAEREQQAQRAADERIEREAQRRLAEEKNNELKSATYNYYVGTELEFKGEKVTVLNITDDKVTLNDLKLPLIPQEVSRKEFEEQIRLSPHNDFLIEKTDTVKADGIQNKADGVEETALSEEIEAAVNGEHEISDENAENIEEELSEEERYSSVDELYAEQSVSPEDREYDDDEDIVDRNDDYGFEEYDDDDEFGARRQIEPLNLTDAFGKSEIADNGQSDITDTQVKTETSKSDQIILSDVAIQHDPAVTEPSEPQQSTTEQPAAGLRSVVIDLRPREPEIAKTPVVKGTNYRIHNDELGYGGKKEKYARNIAAIRTLQQIESENRTATPEEQEVLAQYVGWGGISEVFEENNSSWKVEYADLKELLTEKEYEAARGSTLNAHYTSPTVIKAIYECVKDMGFEGGNILEPSCGVGNFFGMLPDELQKSKLYGTELDSVTGRIAKQLYPNANIDVQGFEQSDYQDNFFDLAIGNVPFGNYTVADKRYDKHHFSIHEYFIAKTLDKVRPGGVAAFVISRFALDKKNSAVRKYLAERAELLGAVRLPNNAFLKNAGTGVTSDIIFLKKRDRPQVIDEPWISTIQTEEGFTLNSYFAEHPEMVLGTLTSTSTQYGQTDITCEPIEGADLGEQLKEALSKIEGQIEPPEIDIEEEENRKEVETLPADPSVRNYSYTLVDGKIFFRQNSVMQRELLPQTAESRIKGMIEIRDCMRELMYLQTIGAEDPEIHSQQQKLNRLYDNYTSKFGILNSRGNSMAFSKDSSYYLICSLEVLDDEGKLKGKADMFTKRTIRARRPVTSVDTPAEALAMSLCERGKLDMEYMESLSSMTEDEIIAKLQGAVYWDLEFDYFADTENFDLKQFKLVTADEYLTGNVRRKLKTANLLKAYLEENNGNPEAIRQLDIQIAALKKAQPKDLTASEIDVRLGATWLPEDVVQQFMIELLNPSPYLQRRIKVLYSPATATWNITNKTQDSENIMAKNTYGTARVSAYKIIEETLNLKDVRVFDTTQDEYGNPKKVLNAKETMIAQQKQQAIKDAFRNWIWNDMDRRDRLTTMYNELFNSNRPREYDGSNLTFPGMNPEITLREHQRNAIARVIYGGNTLLAHVVGAGKTYEMTAAAMELKRLGLCQKSLFVVPNHLTGQWGAEFLQLYPSANILVATKKDFETANRKKFCARIASGDYDAVIIGHSQFEKIPLSTERQQHMLQEQIDEIAEGIRDLKSANGERYTIKQMEKSKKQLEAKLKKLIETGRKDDVITFEELGVDRLFVDEAHGYKNLFLYTKMRNVAGLAQTEAQKSADLFGKTRYLDDLTGGKGVIFATGTPISNSMTELYTMQRYLQYELLREKGFTHFDSWASTFGETVTSIELKPEGTGYRPRTRFAKFYNLPELLSMFKECADIRTADTLNLPVPKANYHTEVSEPSEYQVEMVKQFGERAEDVRGRKVDPSEDNMLKITNDGRKLALDQRIINPILPDEIESKVNKCADNIFRIYQETAADKGTQLVFSDLSTPHETTNIEKNENGEYDFSDKEFKNVYEDIMIKLIQKGIPKEEIAFIHDANTDARKLELFSKVRSGKVRVLFGSTFKMGAGTNVQDKLKALHHLDIPWVPCSIEQREGRAIRQGNMYDEVDIFRYVTKSTFDSYMWQTLENKQKFISQIMTSKAPVRSCEDIDETALSYAEVKMLATGNPHIKEKMDLDIAVTKLRALKSEYLTAKYSMEDKAAKYFPQKINETRDKIEGLKKDIELYKQKQSEEFPGMELDGKFYKDKKEAGAKLLDILKHCSNMNEHTIGTYKGFAMNLFFDAYGNRSFFIELKGCITHKAEMGVDEIGNITRLDNALAGIEKKLEIHTEKIAEYEKQLEIAKEQSQKPFEYEEELAEKEQRLAAVTALLNLDQHASDAVDLEPDEEPEKSKNRER